MDISKPEPSILGKLVPLKRDKDGNPLFIEMPLRVQLMESAANDLFEQIGSLTLTELKSLPIRSSLMEAIIAVRVLMGGEGSI